jgi:hypothetical protein
MKPAYQARWISKQRLEELRRTRQVQQGIVLDSFNGFLIVEPVGSDLGDGPILSPEEADFELQPVWCSGPRARLRAARELLGLDPEGVPERSAAPEEEELAEAAV